MNLKNNFIWVSFHLTVFLAVCLLVLPSFLDAWSGIWQVSLIGKSASRTETMSEEEQRSELEKALAYNKQLAEEQESKAFVYQGLSGAGTEYDKLLASASDDTMGYLEIPKIDLYLPVCHGTESDKLNYEVGHMYGTSLPVGGPSAHSVLAAHTGLPQAELFTDLIKMEKGDVFYVHVLNKVHCYTVDQILTVPQGTESPYLQIEKGKDQITLYTCTPYGINDHRLLVRGIRTMPDRTAEEAGDGLLLKQKNMAAAARAAGLGALPILILLFGCADLNHRINKRRKSNETKKSGQE